MHSESREIGDPGRLLMIPALPRRTHSARLKSRFSRQNGAWLLMLGRLLIRACLLALPNISIYRISRYTQRLRPCARVITGILIQFEKDCSLPSWSV